MQYLAMKLKGLALLGLIPALLLSSVSPSIADSTPSPSPSSSASPDFKTLMDLYKLNLEKYRVMQNPVLDSQLAAAQYKSALEIYRKIQISREELKIQINRTFMASVDKSNKDARTALKSAKSAAAKNEALVKQKTAIAAASNVRDFALTELGNLPLAPVKPLKQAESSSGKKTKKSSPSPSREDDN